MGLRSIIDSRGRTVIGEYDDIVYVGNERNAHYYWVLRDDVWGIYEVRSLNTNPQTSVSVGVAPLIIAGIVAVVAKRRRG